MFDIKHKKMDEKSQVGVQYNQPDDSLSKHVNLQLTTIGTNIKSQRNELRQNLQLFLKSRPSKVNLTEKGIRSVTDTLQRRLSVRQNYIILQARGILKLSKGPMTMSTDFENFLQLDEQNEDKSVTKRHHKPAPSHILSNEFVNKATLDQIAKSYPTLDNNDMNQPSMIWQVQDCKRDDYNDAYYLSTRDYVVDNRVELNNNRKGTIKSIGKDNWLGIELEESNMKNHNDNIYFTTKEYIITEFAKDAWVGLVFE
ncbi:hypothetical protein RFI_35728 [Reticulomyxa filosa]|uniref:Uncharacterized protein n=1 Tax=Reticulomyxa filosa TaxID=46433 RepID=X6LK11_RETFI|nr:hypothetical protein RFI_35728 [Reticulomyxa filosa]|eukprot:ETO01711.1 hypothetical protein RFI_35728 [Reticulomyxa filosa]